MHATFTVEGNHGVHGRTDERRVELLRQGDLIALTHQFRRGGLQFRILDPELGCLHLEHPRMLVHEQLRLTACLVLRRKIRHGAREGTGLLRSQLGGTHDPAREHCAGQPGDEERGGQCGGQLVECSMRWRDRETPTPAPHVDYHARGAAREPSVTGNAAPREHDAGVLERIAVEQRKFIRQLVLHHARRYQLHEQCATDAVFDIRGWCRDQDARLASAASDRRRHDRATARARLRHE